jgi:hypothetical protein
MPFILLQTGLFEDGSKRSLWHVDTGSSGYRYGARLHWMSKLAMASLRSDQQPTILSQTL